MANIFHPAMNTLSRVSIFGAVFILAGIIGVAWVVVRTPYVTGAGVIREQPVPFSHQHHVGDAGIDCRYCHTTVETSAFAGIPSTSVCMNCHTYLFRDQPMLEPVRDSYRRNIPLQWTRVHNIPDFAQFDHSVHIHKGIGCVSCHGQVDRMPLMWRENTLQMEWCLSCHNHPAEHVRPREFVFHMASLEELAETEEFRDYLEREFPSMDAEHPDLMAVRRELAQRYDLQSETNCSNCHW